jgi:hypothetical protein
MSDPIAVVCSTCGGAILEDARRGLRAVVTCFPCLKVAVCINCRRPFAPDESQFTYTADAILVGPFCQVCEHVVHKAKAAVLQ